MKHLQAQAVRIKTFLNILVKTAVIRENATNG